jgi:drug/metabolite transporter (DMT)-like permease
MPHLLVVSLIWAFSFGLIRHVLSTAGLQSGFISAARLGLALLVFLPFLRIHGVRMRTGLSLIAIGAIQFGLMYLAYNESFRHLQAHEVALLTLTTPVLVTLLADALERRFRLRALLAAVLAVAGALFVTDRTRGLSGGLTGVLLVQASNLAFAVGQVWYRRLRLAEPALRDRDVFGLLYAGAFILTLPVALAQSRGVPFQVTPIQGLTLLYLGVIASGLGFFLWNTGAARTSAGRLAVMNNAKIPLAVAVSLLVFGERADLLSLGGALGLMAAAVWLAGPPAADSAPTGSSARSSG